MWTFDRFIVAFGVVATMIAAISPVVIALINRGKKEEPKEPEATNPPPVVQGMTVETNVSAEYVAFVKAKLEQEEDEHRQTRERLDWVEYERNLAHQALREHGIPIPVIYQDPNKRH